MLEHSERKLMNEPKTPKKKRIDNICYEHFIPHPLYFGPQLYTTYIPNPYHVNPVSP